MVKTNRNGFTLVEVMVGLAIMLTAVVASSLAFRATLRAVNHANRITQAAFLLEEGVEAVKLIRGDDWANLSGLENNVSYTLIYGANTWTTQTAKSFVDNIFDRTVLLEPVYRDANQDIASSGTLDSGTRKLTVTVSWREQTGTTTKSLSTYVADI